MIKERIDRFIQPVEVINTLPKTTIDELYDLQRQSYTVEKVLLNIDTFPPLFETSCAFAQADDAILMCTEKGSVRGFLQYEVTKDRLMINKLVVHPNYFRTGVASDLLQALIDLKGDKSIQVETAQENIPAMTLYQKHGLTDITPLKVAEGLQLVKLVMT